MRSPFVHCENRPTWRFGRRGASIPGPQKPGTGGTLGMVWRSRRDRRHPSCRKRRDRSINFQRGAAGAKEVAEKGRMAGEFPEKLPSGAKALVDSAALTARLKSCPFKTVGSSAACK